MAINNDTSLQSGHLHQKLQSGTHQNDMFLTDDAIISRALQILENRARYATDVTMGSPVAVRDYCKLKLGLLLHEMFAVIWLDNQNRLIEFEEMFRGTLTQASVYPREVVKSALAHNAAAVILVHNHPSGIPTPSQHDIRLTKILSEALTLVDVRVLDHVVVTATETVSLAEKGLI